MNMLVVDDEDLVLEEMIDMLKKEYPEAEVFGFSSPKKALEFSKQLSERQKHIDIAFLDVEMYGVSGIQLAKLLKEQNSSLNVIFVTGYSAYAVDAFAVHASGYLLKPVEREDLIREVSNLRIPVVESNGGRTIRVQTFGNFEMFVNEEPVKFKRSKCKELLAYLVDRRGAGVSTSELLVTLWEDKESSISLQKQFQTVVSDLMKSLKDVNADNIVIRKRNSISVDTTKFDCDYYAFLQGDKQSRNQYLGEYMSNYSWAEFTTGRIEEKIHNDK